MTISMAEDIAMIVLAFMIVIFLSLIFGMRIGKREALEERLGKPAPIDSLVEGTAYARISRLERFNMETGMSEVCLFVGGLDTSSQPKLVFGSYIDIPQTIPNEFIFRRHFITGKPIFEEIHN